MNLRSKPPAWFWVVVVVLLLWGVMGVVGFYLDLNASPAERARMDSYDQSLYANRPAWFIWCYGLAVWSGLIGSALLLARKAAARPIYIVSLIAVVVMFGWMFVATDIVAHKGLLTAAGFPVVIALLAVAEIWLANHARRRGWIG